jgi:hypothetical protein
MSRGKVPIVVGEVMIFAMLIMAMAGCVSREPEHGNKHALIDSFNTTTVERQTLEQRAAKGDAEAATKLGDFHALVLCDDVAALHWYKRAAALGGTQEQRTYESYVSTLRSDE